MYGAPTGFQRTLPPDARGRLYCHKFFRGNVVDSIVPNCLSSADSPLSDEMRKPQFKSVNPPVIRVTIDGLCSGDILNSVCDRLPLLILPSARAGHRVIFPARFNADVAFGRASAQAFRLKPRCAPQSARRSGSSGYPLALALLLQTPSELVSCRARALPPPETLRLSHGRQRWSCLQGLPGAGHWRLSPLALPSLPPIRVFSNIIVAAFQRPYRRQILETGAIP